MQKISRDVLVNRAIDLLDSGSVEAVLGWSKGEFVWDNTPTLFTSKEQIEKDFVWGDFCGANLSKYLVSKTREVDGKILVFLKPCDTYSFNQLLTENRIKRDNVYVVGISCEGMCDPEVITKCTDDAIANIESVNDKIVVKTIFDEKIELDFNDTLEYRCKTCKSRKHVAYDELLGDEGEVLDGNRFDQVKELEKMSADERFDFWQNHLSRCIRCNACRNVCPACTCEKCVFDNPDSPMENKAPSSSFEEQAFHIIRAFHVAGRCTDCGECSRVCPENIPLHILNRKFICDINMFYGDYQAGQEVGQLSPLTDYTLTDIEPGDAVGGGK